MTGQLKSLFRDYSPLKQGTQAHCRYDVLVKDYDNCGRDLLIEAKPDPDRGAIRIAIGQLLDYRRNLPNRLATDLGTLTIFEPPESYMELLFDLQITAFWFSDETCRENWPAGVKLGQQSTRRSRRGVIQLRQTGDREFRSFPKSTLTCSRLW